MPYCLLLGLEFLTDFEIDIDLKFNCCKHNDFRIADLFLHNCAMNDADSPVLMLGVENSHSSGSLPHKIKISKIHDELCFELEGDPD